MNNTITDLFPYRDDAGAAAFRKYQYETIEAIIEAFKKTDYVILEAPTGAGKSVIAMTLARYFREAYIITPQKILQDQYLDDFSSLGLRTIKGRANYVCNLNPEVNAAESPCVQSQEYCEVCNYLRAKEAAATAPYTVFNPYYFLLEQSTFVHERELMVIDEAHLTEKVLMQHVSLEISQRGLTAAGIDTPIIDRGANLRSWDGWLRDVHNAVRREQSTIMRNMREAETSGAIARVHSLSNKTDMLRRIETKIHILLYDTASEDWVIEYDDQESRVSFKPIYVRRYFPRFSNRGNKVLCMSATILDAETFAASLDIPDYEYIAMPSTFPVKNRPIYVAGVGRMSYRYIKKNLPKLVERIQIILDMYPDDKGIIHCTSYFIQRYLYDNIASSRLLAHDSGNRDEILARHIENGKPSVLLSPSMTEGLDLAEDLARFQVICKVPYPAYNDPQIKARRALDPEWYQLQTALTVVQSYGRAVRSPDDRADTFILDSSFHYFRKQNGDILPTWFVEAIKSKDDMKSKFGVE